MSQIKNSSHETYFIMFSCSIKIHTKVIVFVENLHS